MPEICRFYGIIIRFYYREHPPTQFHNHELTRIDTNHRNAKAKPWITLITRIFRQNDRICKIGLSFDSVDCVRSFFCGKKKIVSGEGARSAAHTTRRPLPNPWNSCNPWFRFLPVIGVHSCLIFSLAPDSSAGASRQLGTRSPAVAGVANSAVGMITPASEILKRRQVGALRKGAWLPRSFYAPKRFARVSLSSVPSACRAGAPREGRWLPLPP